MFLSEILIFVLALFVVHHLWKYIRFFYLASKIPKSDFEYSLQSLRILSNGDAKQLFKIMISTYKNKNHISKTWLGHVLNVGIIQPEDVKIIFNSKACMGKPKAMKLANALKGSIFGELEYWQSHRKILNPYFGALGVKSMIPIFKEKVKIFMENLKKFDCKGEFDILSSIMTLAMETIIKVMDFDADLQNQKPEINDDLLHNLEKYTKIFSSRMLKFWIHPDCIYKRTSMYREQIEAESKSVLKFTNSIVQNAREKYDKEEIGSDGKIKTFMRALVDPKNNLSQDEIHDEVKTLLIAGLDTSAIVTSTTLLMLAMHKNVQQKVLDELHRVIGNVTDAPYLEIKDLNELTYLEMVINEVMRLFPVVPFAVRKNSDEIKLSEGYVLPAGTDIIIPIFIIQRSKQIWGEDAEEFRPERFEKVINPYGFIPFAKGARMCLGWRYAMYFLKIKLVNILLRYELDTTFKYEELNLQWMIVLNICQGYNISIKERLMK